MIESPLVDLSVHHAPRDLCDRIAPGFTKTPRFCADTFFAKRSGHRAIVQETLAVPCMVGAPAGLAPVRPLLPYPGHADDIRIAA